MERSPVIFLHGSQDTVAEVSPILSDCLSPLRIVLTHQPGRMMNLELYVDFITASEVSSTKESTTRGSESIGTGGVGGMHSALVCHLFIVFIARDGTFAADTKNLYLETLRSVGNHTLLILVYTYESAPKPKLFGKSAFSGLPVLKSQLGVEDVIVLKASSHPGDHNSQAAKALLQDKLSASLSTRFLHHEKVLRLYRQARHSQTKWTFLALLRLQEDLALAYEMFGALDDALMQYQELEALLTESIVDMFHRNYHLEWLLHALAATDSWPGINLNASSITQYSSKIYEQDDVSYLELRNYLFARKAHLLFTLQKPWSVSESALAFVMSVHTELSHCSAVQGVQGAKSAWMYCTAREILAHCNKYLDSTQVAAFTVSTAQLWNVARKSLQILGQSCGLFGWERQSTTHINAAIDLMAKMDRSDDNESSLALRRALSSKENFDIEFLNVTEITIATLKHIGHRRFVHKVCLEFADYYLANQQWRCAEKLLLDALRHFNSEGWHLFRDELLRKVFLCQQHQQHSLRQVDLSILAAASSESHEGRSEAMSHVWHVASSRPQGLVLPMNTLGNIRSIVFVDDESSLYSNVALLRVRLDCKLPTPVQCRSVSMSLYDDHLHVMSQSDVLNCKLKVCYKLDFQLKTPPEFMKYNPHNFDTILLSMDRPRPDKLCPPALRCAPSERPTSSHLFTPVDLQQLSSHSFDPEGGASTADHSAAITSQPAGKEYVSIEVGLNPPLLIKPGVNELSIPCSHDLSLFSRPVTLTHLTLTCFETHVSVLTDGQCLGGALHFVNGYEDMWDHHCILKAPKDLPTLINKDTFYQGGFQQNIEFQIKWPFAPTNTSLCRVTILETESLKISHFSCDPVRFTVSAILRREGNSVDDTPVRESLVTEWLDPLTDRVIASTPFELVAECPFKISLKHTNHTQHQRAFFVLFNLCTCLDFFIHEVVVNSIPHPIQCILLASQSLAFSSQLDFSTKEFGQIDSLVAQISFIVKRRKSSLSNVFENYHSNRPTPEIPVEMESELTSKPPDLAQDGLYHQLSLKVQIEHRHQLTPKYALHRSIIADRERGASLELGQPYNLEIRVAELGTPGRSNAEDDHQECDDDGVLIYQVGSSSFGTDSKYNHWLVTGVSRGRIRPMRCGTLPDWLSVNSHSSFAEKSTNQSMDPTTVHLQVVPVELGFLPLPDVELLRTCSQSSAEGKRGPRACSQLPQDSAVDSLPDSNYWCSIPHSEVLDMRHFDAVKVVLAQPFQQNAVIVR